MFRPEAHVYLIWLFRKYRCELLVARPLHHLSQCSGLLVLQYSQRCLNDPNGGPCHLWAQRCLPRTKTARPSDRHILFCSFHKKKLFEISERVFVFRSITKCGIMRDFRLPPRCKRDLRSSGILRGVDWQLVTDVSVQPIGPIFKGQAVQVLTREDQTYNCSETFVTYYQLTLR